MKNFALICIHLILVLGQIISLKLCMYIVQGQAIINLKITQKTLINLSKKFKSQPFFYLQQKMQIIILERNSKITFQSFFFLFQQDFLAKCKSEEKQNDFDNSFKKIQILTMLFFYNKIINNTLLLLLIPNAKGCVQKCYFLFQPFLLELFIENETCFNVIFSMNYLWVQKIDDTCLHCIHKYTIFQKKSGDSHTYNYTF
eukprot:TRINITY_DN7935_c0_g1_i1.p3 TRINITY_DN7935_c0_g1~~TRINITY_DN7935_c0_g1_i1.p3  ORF type:complete len:200 (-),score=-13.69 TRINITY_DN7935_c0_g1_i1:144-743(-)